MPVEIDSQTLDAAVDALGVRGTPVYSARAIGDRIELWLCGRTEPVTWSPGTTRTRAGAKVEAKAEDKPADFSEITGIGRATRDALHKSGITTWIGLKRADDERLLQVVNPRQLLSIRSHFAKG